MSTNDIHQDSSTSGRQYPRTVRIKVSKEFPSLLKKKIRFYRRIIAFLSILLACSLVSAPYFYHLYQNTLDEYEDLYISHISLQDDLTSLQEEYDSFVANSYNDSNSAATSLEADNSALADYVEGENTVVIDGENFKTFYTTDRINLRLGPGTNYESIALIPAGTDLSIDTSSDNVWKKTYYNGNYGYVSGDYLSEDIVSYSNEGDYSDDNYRENDYSDDYEHYDDDDDDDTYYDPLVWISATGEKYHNKPNCGRMNPNKAYQMTLSEAQASGYGACQNCF